MRNIFTVILGILILAINLSGQDVLTRERELLYKNIDLYKTGRYEKAIQNFTLMIDRLPDSPFLTTNFMMKAKSEYKDAQYTTSLQTVKTFLDKFPESRYKDEMYYLMGNNYYRLNRYNTAINAWDRSLSITDDRHLLDRLSYLITRTAQYRLTKNDISELQSESISEDCQVLLAIAEAENLVANNNRYKAQILIEQTLTTYPQSRFKDKAKMLLESGQTNNQDEMKIALLLPLSGYNAEIGEAIRAGADFAIREYNQVASHPLKLIVKDYGEDMTTALRFYKEISQRNDILAMFGPIENDIVSACAALSDYEHLPIISPTATDNDLTTLTDYFFQVNSTLEMRADMLATYAVDSLGIKRFATFSPIENHFAQMVDEFTRILKTRSIEVVTQQWYYPSDQDMHKQFMNIKRIGLWYAFADSLRLVDPSFDSLKIDSLYRVYKKNEEERLKETQTKIDSADIAVSSIDGIFIPIYKEDIKFIAPQIAYSNIQSHYLGNGDWYNPEELKKNKNYINGLIFISDGFLDEENWDYRNFRNKYRESLNVTPNTYNLIGYDCMRFMLKPFEKGNMILNRTEYMSRLKQIGRFDGLYRRILLDDQNRNTALRILRFNYGQIIPVN